MPDQIYFATSSKSKFNEFVGFSSQFKWAEKVCHLNLKGDDIVEPQSMCVKE
ncbi:MAG: hypothetical protein MHPSP_002479, partial [Paramarteilia canceri]